MLQRGGIREVFRIYKLLFRTVNLQLKYYERGGQ